jgi:hypothetical protein
MKETDWIRRWLGSSTFPFGECGEDGSKVWDDGFDRTPSLIHVLVFYTRSERGYI